MAGSNGGTAGSNGRLEALYNARQFTHNLMMLRQDLTSFLTDRRRNIEDECGYPKSYDVALYQLMFDTEAIANRVVSVLPDECSKVQPRIYESDDDQIDTSFEKDLYHLNLGLQGEENFCFDEEGSALAEIFDRADRVCGVGRFGITLIGTGGNSREEADYSLPLTFSRPGAEVRRKLLHLSCYPEYLARIASIDDDQSSVRFGQPTSYQIDFGGLASGAYPGYGTGISSLGLSSNSTVHWTRVVHHVDNPFSSTVYGIPRQQPVMRRLLDLQKSYAATGEAIWQVGVPGFSVESDPSLGGEVDYDPNQLKDSVERYMNGFQRWMLANGFVIKSLAPQMADFTPHMSTLLEAICIQLAIPMRVFRGSEIGERASLEDAKRWRITVASRRRKHVLPRIIRPLLNRLISLGCLSRPGKGGYHVWWPDVETNTPDEQANIALKGAQALDTYSRGTAQDVMSPFEFLVTQMGMSESDARRMVDETEARRKEREELARTVQTPGGIGGQPTPLAGATGQESAPAAGAEGGAGDGGGATAA